MNDGKGVPVFTGEVDCTYFFNWDTKYACVKEKEDLLCRVTDQKKHYDLSPLTRYSGTALMKTNVFIIVPVAAKCVSSVLLKSIPLIGCKDMVVVTCTLVYSKC